MSTETATATGTNAILRAEGLTKHYGDVRAVDGISFFVPCASVFTLLGPN